MSHDNGKDQAKPRWVSPHGNRYTCWSCGVKFYDLGKKPALCPSCGVNQADEPTVKDAPTARASRSKVVEAPVEEEILNLIDEEEAIEGDLEDLEDVTEDEDEIVAVDEEESEEE